MRQITRDSVVAFVANTAFNKANMSVKNNIMMLHGNPIAKKEGKKLFISAAGWETNTTKERLNGVLDVLCIPGTHIFQKDFVWYLNGKGCFDTSNSWQDVSDLLK